MAGGKLIYFMIASLDGYVTDRNGNIGWAEPDEEVHEFVREFQEEINTYLYGRRLYETMAVWEDMDLSNEPPYMHEYARVWRSAEKIVYSSTLTATPTANTRVERSFDAEAVAQLKETATSDMTIGGPTLAAEAFKAGLVDECHLLLAPAVIGGGSRFLPDDMALRLQLLDERRFDSGIVYLRYETSLSQTVSRDSVTESGG